MTVEQVMESQVNYVYGRSPRHLTATFMQLMLPFEATEVVQQLKLVLQDQTEINWEAILTFTATFLVCFPESPALIQGM